VERANFGESTTNAPAAVIEWPTCLVGAALYGGWLLLTWYAAVLPWWVVVPIGSWLVAWHNSLQHECVHGHPTRRRWLNTAIAYFPIGLLIPYVRYRTTHLAHHRTPLLTTPVADPESFYWTTEQWQRLPRPVRWLLICNNSLLGRLILGPAIVAVRFLSAELRALARGDTNLRRVWLWHLIALGIVTYWVVAVCGIPFWFYAFGIAYPGLSLVLLSYYFEHRPAVEPGHRTAVIQSHPLMRLLYLNNNYHAVHHAKPSLAWYRIPAAYRAARDTVHAGNGGFVMPGYATIAAHYLFVPKDSPVYPAPASAAQ
jgi:fatty acid desaturase